LRAELDRIVCEASASEGVTVGALIDDGIAINVLSVARVVSAIRARGGGRS